MSVIANALVRFHAQDSGLFRQMMRIERGFGTMKTSYMQFAAATAGVALFGKAIKDSIDFEAELFNVRKTTNLTVDQVKRLGNEFIDLSTKTGIARKKLAEIGVVAGQLGIVQRGGGGEAGLKALEKFTESVAKSRLAMPDFADSSEEAATKVAKLLNIMNLSVDQTDALLSSINELSNTTAAGSDDIGEFTRRLGGTAVALGSTAANVTALSATLTEVGVNAELGGTAITRLMVKGQENIEDFTKALGSAGQEFKTAFIQDPIKGLQILFKEMNKMNKADQFKFMDDLSINSVRLIGVMNKLASDRGIASLESALGNANNAFKKSISLEKEFEIRMESTQSAAERFFAALGFVGQTLSEQLFPVIKDFSLAMVKTFKSTDFQNGIKATGNAISTLASVFVGLVKIVFEYREIFSALFVGALAYKAIASIRLIGNALVALQTKMDAIVFSGKKVNTFIRGLAAARAAGAFFPSKKDIMAVGAGKASFLGAGKMVPGHNTLGQFNGTKVLPALTKTQTLFYGIATAVRIATAAAIKFTIALATNPLTWVIGAVVVLGLLAKRSREVAEGFERMKKFGENFDFLKGFGQSGNDVIKQVNNTVKAVEKYKESVSSFWFGIAKHPIKRGDIIQGIGIDAENIRKANIEVEKLRDKIEHLKKVGGIDDNIFDALFEKKDDIWIIRDGKEAEKAVESLNSALSNFQEKSDQFSRAFDQVFENTKDALHNIPQILSETASGFTDWSKETTDELQRSLASESARAGDFFKAYAITASLGLTSDEANAAFDNANAHITDRARVALMLRGKDYKEPGIYAAGMYANGLIDAEDVVAASSGKLSVAGIDALSDQRILDAYGRVGKLMGGSFAEGLAAAAAEGTASALIGIATSMELAGSAAPGSAQAASFAAGLTKAQEKMKEIVQDIKDNIGGGYGGLGDDGSAEKAKKAAEERLKLEKERFELQKKMVEIGKSQAEKNKERLEKLKEVRDLTKEEKDEMEKYKKEIKESNFILKATPSHLYSIQERMNGLVDRVKNYADAWSDAADKVADFEVKIAEINKQMKENSDEFKKLYGDDPNKLGGEAAKALASEAGMRVAELEQEKKDIEKKMGKGEFDQADQERIQAIEEEIGWIRDKYKISGTKRKEEMEAQKALKEQEEKVFMLQAKEYMMKKKGGEELAKWTAEMEKQQEILNQMRTPTGAADTVDSFTVGLERGRKLNEAPNDTAKKALEEEFNYQDALLEHEEKQNELKKEGVDLENKKTEALKEQIEAKKLLDAVDERTRKRLSNMGFSDSEIQSYTDATNQSAPTGGQDSSISGTDNNAQQDETQNQQRLTSRQQTLDQLLKLEQDHLALLAQERTNAWAAQLAEMRENYKIIREETKALTDALINMWNAVFAAMQRASGGGGSSRSRGSSGGGGYKGGYADDFMKGFVGGGYTANVGMFKPAGIVHGGEWVAPMWMVKRFPGLIDALEGLRIGKSIKGFMSGGLVGMQPQPAITKSNEIKVEMINHIRDQLDMRAVAEQLGYSLGNRLLT